MPTAKKFKRWVTADVLPTVRKHGAYATEDTLEKMLASPDFGIKLLTKLKSEQKKRKAAEATIEEQKPKVLFAQAVETSKTSILIGELAKLIKQNGVDIGQNRLFAWMRENGYIVKGGTQRNMPTQKSMKLGIMEIKERTINNPDGSVRLTKTPKVTGKGQTYFVNKFLRNHLPGLIVAGIGCEHLRLEGPVLIDLRREFHEIPCHGSPADTPVGTL